MLKRPTLEMLGFLFFAVVGQGTAPMSAEEIKNRLETPISYRTDPVRLPVALDAIGSLVGVRVRCESYLQQAVVVVGVRGKPAREVIQHLMDGIGAGSAIQGGTLNVGIRIATETQKEKQKTLEIVAIRSMLESRSKLLELDKPVDLVLAATAAAHAVNNLNFRPDPGYYYAPVHPSMYTAIQRCPAGRASARIMLAIGPELLQADPDRPRVITLNDLEPAPRQEVIKALNLLDSEQAAWSKEFVSARNIPPSDRYSGNTDALLAWSVPITGTKPNGFRLRINPTTYARVLTMDLLAGGVTLFDLVEYLPKQRTYVAHKGQPYDVLLARSIRVPLGAKALALHAFFQPKQDERESNSWRFRQDIANPWRNEPIAYTPVQPLAEVAQQLNLNVVAYLGDTLVQSIPGGYYRTRENPISGTDVLNLVNYGSATWLRKDNDWLLAYTHNPESYLAGQIDRIALGNFLNLALKPGAMTFDQFASAKKKMGANQFQIARQLAQLVRPGFDSLNPINLDLIEMFQTMSPAQLRQAMREGVSVGSLPLDVQNKIGMYSGLSRRRSSGIPDDSIDAPPTQADIKQSKLTVTQTSQNGFISAETYDGRLTSSMQNIHYRFNSFEQNRSYSVAFSSTAPASASQSVWLARMDTLQFQVEIPRKRSRVFSTNQYVTDVSVNPLSRNQIEEAIRRNGPG